VKLKYVGLLLIAIYLLQVGAVSATMVDDALKTHGTINFKTKFNLNFFDVEKNPIQTIQNSKWSSKWSSYDVNSRAAYVSYDVWPWVAGSPWELKRDMVPLDLSNPTTYNGKKASIFIDAGGSLGSTSWSKIIINGNTVDYASE
jgi:hypothetical protein